MLRLMTSTTLRGIEIQALRVTSRSDYLRLRTYFSFSHSRLPPIGDPHPVLYANSH